jgi:hypothetical protein
VPQESCERGPPEESRGHWAAAETEADCEAVFRGWLRRAGTACPQCRSRAEPLELAGRRVLQCRACGGQRGLRHGTFLAHSNVAFTAFFRVVRLLAHDPKESLARLHHATDLSTKTIRKLRSRILQAFRDPPQRRELLACCGWQPEQATRTTTSLSRAS